MSEFEDKTIPSNGVAVTLSDTVDIPTGISTVLYVGNGGDVKVLTNGGSTITLTNVQDGTFIPLQVVRVFSTDTTATNITALY